jgi:hypothetical protein
MIKSRKMRQAGHVARMEKRNEKKNIGGKARRKDTTRMAKI